MKEIGIGVLRTGDTMTGILTSVGIDFTNHDATNLASLRGAGGSVFNMNDGASTTRAGMNASHLIFPVQAPTAAAPAYVKGGMYFDTTLNKLRIGGAAGWETVTSA